MICGKCSAEFPQPHHLECPKHPQNISKINDPCVNDGWLVDLNNPKFTPELREILQNIFSRLAYLNTREVGGMDRQKLTENEELERQILKSLTF